MHFAADMPFKSNALHSPLSFSTFKSFYFHLDGRNFSEPLTISQL